MKYYNGLDREITFEEAIEVARNHDACSGATEIIEVVREDWVKLSKAPEWMVWYAYTVIKGRWKEAEEYIIKDYFQAYHYAITVLKGRWKEAEEYFMRDPSYACCYARYVIKGRWKEAEEYIKKDRVWSYTYAYYVLDLHREEARRWR